MGSYFFLLELVTLFLSLFYPFSTPISLLHPFSIPFLPLYPFSILFTPLFYPFNIPIFLLYPYIPFIPFISPLSLPIAVYTPTCSFAFASLCELSAAAVRRSLSWFVRVRICCRD